MERRRLRLVLVLLSCALAAAPAWAQVDTELAERYFAEANQLCGEEAGRLWDISLCGPMVFADAISGTVATSQPTPDAPQPRLLGIVNAPVRWGDQRWSAYVWGMIPADDQRARGRLLIHELFHRVQADLDLMVMGRLNTHLDELDGRYWVRLEWRALARALESEGPARQQAASDALAFRLSRRLRFPEGAEGERADELREGLAQYTGTVVAATSRDAAISDAVTQLRD